MRVILTPKTDTAVERPTEQTSGIAFSSTKDENGDLKDIVLTIYEGERSARTVTLDPTDFKAAVNAIQGDLDF